MKLTKQSPTVLDGKAFYTRILLAAFICCFALPSAAMAVDKTLRLGGPSPIVGGMARGRIAQAKDLTSDLKADTAEDLRAAKSKMKGRLGGFNLVVADMKTAKKKDLEIVLQTASELGIDVVLENVDGKEMAALYGIGYDASAVVIKTDPATGAHEVQFVNEDETESRGFSEGEIVTKTETRKYSQEELAKAESEATKKGLKKTDKITRKGAGKGPEKLVKPKTRFTKAEVSRRVDEILKKNMPQKGRHYSNSVIPDYAFKHFFFPKSNSYNVPGSTLNASVNWEVKLFAAKNPAVKRMQISTYGSGANANPTQVGDGAWDRYYYLRKWETTMGPNAYWAPGMSGWAYNDKRVAVNRWDPKTANRQTTISYTTGWDISVGASKSGPELGGGYSESETTNVTTKDFKLRGDVVGTNNNVLVHTFTGSKPNYQSLKSKTWGDVYLDAVPSSAWDAFGPTVFGEWQVPNTEMGYTYLNLTGIATFGYVKIRNRDYDWAGYITSWNYWDWSPSVASNHGFYLHWGSVDPGV